MNHAGITREMLPEQPVGLFYAWWRGDELPDLRPPDDFTNEFDPAPAAIRRIVNLDDAEIARRAGQGNRAAIGRIGGEAAGIGWSSSGRVEIGELGLDFALPPGNSYVWDFVTIPEWRGRGIYPALLQAFIRAQTDVERFWVGHDLDNTASSRGILKAGFRTVGEVYAVQQAGPVFVPSGPGAERGPAAAALLGLPLLEQPARERDDP